MDGEFDFSGEDPSGFTGLDYGGYDTSGYDPYGSYYDYQDQPDYSGYTGLDYTGGDTSQAFYPDYTNLDMTNAKYGSDNLAGGLDYGGGQGIDYVNPEAELAARGGYTPPQGGGYGWDESKGLLANLASQAAGRFKQNPMEALMGLGKFGTDLYSTIQQNKALEDRAREIKDAKEKREARLAKYGAVLPMKMERQLLPQQGDLLTAGQRGGALNWFTPATFKTMAEGGATAPGWLDRLRSAVGMQRPDPSLVGTGGAAQAGDAIMRQQYQRYAVGRQMEDQEPLPYEAWVASRGRAHGGLTYAHGGGQDDVIDIKAAPGEYVFDSDVVSALGDGNNAEGARKLDAMREHIRQHKRSASASSIPPRARSLASYMRGK